MKLVRSEYDQATIEPTIGKSSLSALQRFDTSLVMVKEREGLEPLKYILDFNTSLVTVKGGWDKPLQILVAYFNTSLVTVKETVKLLLN